MAPPRLLHRQSVGLSPSRTFCAFVWGGFVSFNREEKSMAKQIVIDHVFKVFGDDPQEALALVRQGLSKQDRSWPARGSPSGV